MSKTTNTKSVSELSFEKRILNERSKLRGSTEQLLDRIDSSNYGNSSKKILKQILRSESNGHLYFGLFPCPPAVEKAKGAKMWDADGREYVDFHSGFSVSILGHCNDEVNQAIKTQLDDLQHFAELPCRVRADFSEKILEFAPWDYEKKCLLTVTGGEAIEVTIKLSRWYTGKPLIMTQYGDYHGRTAGAMGLTSKSSMFGFHYPILPADSGIIRFHFAYCYRCPFGQKYPDCDMQCIKAIEFLFESKETLLRNPVADITNVAAMIIEPFQSSAGYIIPPMEYLQGLKNICDKYGVLFVSDEIQTGMGRSGKKWAIEHSGVIPDMITVAKSISNGLPISVTIGRKEIMDSWGPGAHCTTFCGYPVACAGGLKVLEIMERDNIVEQVSNKEKWLTDGLNELKEKHPIIGDFNCKGLYAGIELVRDRKTKAPADKEARYITQNCLENGLIFIASGYFSNRLAFAPPLIISKDEIEEGLSKLDKALTQAEREFRIN